MTGKDKRVETIILTFAGLPATVWLGLIFAPYLEDGLIYFIAEIAKGNIEPLISDCYYTVQLSVALYSLLRFL